MADPQRAIARPYRPGLTGGWRLAAGLQATKLVNAVLKRPRAPA
jgi:hypothetical protein